MKRDRVLAAIVARGCSKIGWFYGFKLHLDASEVGELGGAQLTPGGVDDRGPVPELTKLLSGTL